MIFAARLGARPRRSLDYGKAEQRRIAAKSAVSYEVYLRDRTLRFPFEGHRRSPARGRLVHGEREWKPKLEMCAALPVGTVEHLDESAVRERVFARDRKPQPRALDAA